MKWTQIEKRSGFNKTVDFFTDGNPEKHEIRLLNPERFQDMEVGHERQFTGQTVLYRYQ